MESRRRLNQGCYDMSVTRREPSIKPKRNSAPQAEDVTWAMVEAEAARTKFSPGAESKEAEKPKPVKRAVAKRGPEASVKSDVAPSPSRPAARAMAKEQAPDAKSALNIRPAPKPKAARLVKAAQQAKAAAPDLRAVKPARPKSVSAAPGTTPSASALNDAAAAPSAKEAVETPQTPAPLAAAGDHALVAVALKAVPEEALPDEALPDEALPNEAAAAETAAPEADEPAAPQIVDHEKAPLEAAAPPPDTSRHAPAPPRESGISLARPAQPFSVVEAVAAETIDYSRRSMESASTFVARLFSVRTIEDAAQVPVEYAKKSYSDFVGYMTKIQAAYAGSLRGFSFGVPLR